MPYIYMYDYDINTPGFAKVDKIRLCKDCRHHHKPSNDGEHYQCRRIDPDVVDPVVGVSHKFSSVVNGGLRCYEERQSERADKCGPEGKFWMPKK